MKKILVSAFVLLSFGWYSFYRQTNSISTAVLLPTPVPTSAPSATGSYKDGTYTGNSEDVFYGNIQVQATIAGGRIVDITFLDYPSERQTSNQINEAMIPIMQSEAIRVQSSNVDIVSGATESSNGFRKSLASALAQAQ